MYRINIHGRSRAPLTVTGNHILVLRQTGSAPELDNTDKFLAEAKKVGLNVRIDRTAAHDLLEITVEDFLKLPEDEQAKWFLFLADALPSGFNDDLKNEDVVHSGDYRALSYNIVKETEVSDYVGFKVDGNQRFLRDDFIVLHNSGFEGESLFPLVGFQS